ncbi:fibronectin type III domain-containing protein [Tessaracoccus sp. MC1756]|uniref:fibronectin type III domain-containing protein n=1 Tax=Tessaracoccus sp. MC1756 TaxID=2760311 RepID=UPI00351C493E
MLAEFDFTPKTIDTTTGDKEVVVTARVTDTTGAQTPTLILSSDDTTQTLGFGQMTRISGTATDGVYQRTVTIPTTAATGTWTVTIYPLEDSLGNDDSTFHKHPEKLSTTSTPADTAAPVLAEFDFTPKTIDTTTGDKEVVVTARVTDTTGAQTPTLILSSDDTTQTLGFGQMTRISGTATDGVYQRTVTIPTTAATGTWTVTIYPLEDSLGNDDSTFHKHPEKLSTTSTPADTAAPVLAEFDFTPKTIDTTTGDKEVVVTARVTDTTGAQPPTLILSSDDTTQTLGFGQMTRISGTATDGVYQRTVTIPTTAATGTWTVTIYPLEDSLGNDDSTFHKHPEKLSTTSTPADTAAPVLAEFDFTPKTIDTTTGDKEVVVTARVTDTTGAQPPTLILSSDNTTQTLGFGQMTRISGTATDGVYQRTVTIPTTAATGTWTVTIYPLEDSLGNDDSTFHKHPEKLSTTSTPADTAAPVLAEFDFTPKTIDTTTGDKEVVVTARVTDTTGAQTPTLILSSDNTTQTLGFGQMTRISGTATDGVYQRTVTIPTTAATGTWTVTIYPLEDSLGNDDSTFHKHPTKLRVTIPGATAPSTPQGISATPSNASVKVSWATPISDGGSPITSYTITAQPGSLTKTVNGNTTTATFTGLTNGTAYTFTVQATNQIGTSPASATSAPVTPAGTPTTPARPTATSSSSQQAAVTWQAPFNNGSAITGYTITAQPGNITKTVNGNTTTATFTGLTNGTAYTFTVQATNQIGTSPASARSNAVTPKTSTTPSPPVFDVYTTPGTHHINGRDWRTTCQRYSSTVTRCTTEIWATQVNQDNGRFVPVNGWVFNNLTYAASPRSQWATNPLAANGVPGGEVSWTATDGRKWRTECDTATTGRNGCRSYVEASVIESYVAASGDRGFRWVKKEIFNNMVRFK